MIEEIIEKIIEGRIDVSGSARIYVEILDEDGNYAGYMVDYLNKMEIMLTNFQSGMKLNKHFKKKELNILLRCGKFLIIQVLPSML